MHMQQSSSFVEELVSFGDAGCVGPCSVVAMETSADEYDVPMTPTTFIGADGVTLDCGGADGVTLDCGGADGVCGGILHRDWAAVNVSTSASSKPWKVCNKKKTTLSDVMR